MSRALLISQKSKNGRPFRLPSCKRQQTRSPRQVDGRRSRSNGRPKERLSRSTRGVVVGRSKPTRARRHRACNGRLLKGRKDVPMPRNCEQTANATLRRVPMVRPGPTASQVRRQVKGDISATRLLSPSLISRQSTQLAMLHQLEPFHNMASTQPPTCQGHRVGVIAMVVEDMAAVAAVTTVLPPMQQCTACTAASCHRWAAMPTCTQLAMEPAMEGFTPCLLPGMFWHQALMLLKERTTVFQSSLAASRLHRCQSRRLSTSTRKGSTSSDRSSTTLACRTWPWTSSCVNK